MFNLFRPKPPRPAAIIRAELANLQAQYRYGPTPTSLDTAAFMRASRRLAAELERADPPVVGSLSW